MQVALIAPYFYPLYGGAENQALQLAKSINQNTAASLSVLTLGVPNTVSSEILNGVPIRRFGCYCSETGRTRGYTQMFDWLSQCRSRLDGVHLQLIYGADPEAQLKLLVQAQHLKLWTVVKITSSRYISRMANEWPEAINMLSGVDNIIALNSGISRELQEAGISIGKIAHIPNGVDPTVFVPLPPAEKKGARQKMGLPQTGTICLFVGRLVKKKAVDTLLRAWKLHEERVMDSVLLIVGDDAQDRKKAQQDSNSPCGEVLRELAAQLELNRVWWLGERNHPLEVSRIMQAADIFVLPSRNEGMPNAALEAMSSELPIIGTSIDGILQIVQNRQNGLIVDVDDENQLSYALTTLAKSQQLRKGLGQNARKTVVTNQCFQIVAMKYERLYSALCNVHASDK